MTREPTSASGKTSRSGPQNRGPDIRSRVLDACIHCGLCGAHCAFLSGRDTPGRLAAAWEIQPGPCMDMAFGCSLCGLCTTLCPKHLDLPALFLSWRREAVASGRADLGPYHGILAYEKKGTSSLFSYYHLPHGCDTVFFPGCTLPGTRPGITQNAFRYLCTRIPNMGMVLDCCTKPSHDLGREGFFKAMFSEMCRYLKDRGIHRIITACPSCHILFSHRSPFEALSIYQIMAEDDQARWLSETAPGISSGEGPDKTKKVMQTVMVQDPCQARKDRASQNAVRALAKRAGLDLIPSGASGPATLCCGEGASVGCAFPGLARTWTLKRQKAAQGATTLTYCAGCTHRLGPGALHLLDLAFDRDNTLAGKNRPASAPWTYINRLRIKRYLKGLPSAHERVRRFWAAEKLPDRGLARLIILTGLLLGVVGSFWVWVR